tara:strand:- start:1347 stop:1610 length:264 start_codon:yes stop_codon:yes gene_type:complete
MPKENDPNFIQWVLDYVLQNQPVTASTILKGYNAQLKPYDTDLYDSEKKKSNVNSALYQLLSKGKVANGEPLEGSLAPIWRCTENES